MGDPTIPLSIIAGLLFAIAWDIGRIAKALTGKK
jgi:hypothetical protein